jgi:hypothetical protein
MPLIAPSGNSEGSTYRGADGNAYQVINGQDVRVSDIKLIIPGFKPAPDVMTIGGRTYRRIDGKVFLVNGVNLIPITDENQLIALERQMDGESRNKNLMIAAAVGLILILLLKD